MKSRELKKLSKSALSGHWGIVIGALFIIVILSSVLNGPLQFFKGSFIGVVLSFVISVCILSVMHTGQTWLNLDIYDKREASISTIFSGFTKLDYIRVVLTNVLVGLYSMFWTFLFIIPGVIKFFSYSQTMYILKDYPELSPNQAITKSRELMNGNKLKLFTTLLSFIWWFIFPIIVVITGFAFIFTGASSPGEFVGTIGLMIIIDFLYLVCASVYLAPYFNITMAGFYREIVCKNDTKEELQ